MKGLIALSLAWKQSLKGIQKWPISIIILLLVLWLNIKFN